MMNTRRTTTNKEKLQLSSYYGEFGLTPDKLSQILIIKTSYGEYAFDCTSSAFPEQYDVYDITDRDHMVICGYIRLRHGKLTCDYIHQYGSELVLVLTFMTDTSKGMFSDRYERNRWLMKCLDAIHEREVIIMTETVT